MAKFKMINWQTLPFKRKSFKGQLDRYAKCCIVSVEAPDTILDIITLFGFEQLIKIVAECEQGIDKQKWIPKLEAPIDGEFVEVKSKNGPLYHRYTRDEVDYGLCNPQEIGKAERTETGKVKIYHSIKVFTQYVYDEDTGEKHYLNGWFPDQMYNLYFGYRFIPLSDLTEPLQL